MAQKPAHNAQAISPYNLELGKLPPQALELEETVLGALMLEKDAITDVVDVLKSESFYKPEHQKIYSVILDLFSNDHAIDLLTVTDALRKKKELESIGGPLYITQLTSRVASAAHLEFHARIVQQKYIQRELIRATTEIQNKAFDESVDVEDLIDESESAIFEVAQGNIKKEISSMSSLIESAIKRIEAAGEREDALSGVPSGFSKLDRLTGGWQYSNLIIVAARPAMGKTAFVLSMARNMAIEHERGVALFSLEMSSIELVNRLIVSESEISSDKIKNGSLGKEEWEKLNFRIGTLENAPIFIDDTPAISVFELRAKCRRLKQKHDIQCIIIDYLQLMTGTPESRKNREQEVSTISRALKGLAKELEIPVIALSQLNRGVESRSGYEGKRPQLSDLRESGAIEQDADVVMFIHRPEYYGFIEDGEGNNLKGVAEVILAKHRHGSTGDVSLKFIGEYVKFVDLGDDYFGPVDSAEPVVVKYGSRMNEESSGNTPPPVQTNNDLSVNTGFSDEVPF